jgi:protein-tyrosine kinase
MHRDISSIAVLTSKFTRDTLIGQILLEMGTLKAEDIERVATFQNERNLRFGEAARMLNLASDLDIRRALAHQFNYPYIQPEEGRYARELISAYHPFGPQAAAIRVVRSQLMSCHFIYGRNTLVVIGVGSGLEASLFTANLAVSFAQLGKSTLLVDTNLDRPRQAKIWGLEDRRGFSDILGERSWLEAITSIKHLDHLFVLPAGTPPPNAQELFSRASLPNLRAALASRFEVILYDVFALPGNAWPIAWPAIAGDGVILAVAKDKTLVADVSAATAQLARVGAKMLGTILISPTDSSGTD